MATALPQSRHDESTLASISERDAALFALRVFCAVSGANSVAAEFVLLARARDLARTGFIARSRNSHRADNRAVLFQSVCRTHLDQDQDGEVLSIASFHSNLGWEFQRDDGIMVDVRC